ncbi:Naphthalene 1,2-dioxygenase/salicylate 5-hydroxylase systems, ferredoxin component [Chelatococcus asaccharovorans]|nr:Naphthalene 1,2-dioxygenase/salicylate 5-hydroxylase systems, ferredoxin component [Chelatococcus asaccharovorans]CAH1692951.1 Naphthalene 1,2-dioxygenase/salicylate 5-hydroxylase systems, ferredoxin component [Chelatococcus asaccharovorans]
MSNVMTWVRVATTAAVPLGEMLGVSVNGFKLAIYHLDDDSFRATQNVCTHEFALLSDGWLEGSEVECPLHAGRFDVRTGRALCEPLKRDIAVFAVEVRDGEIFVALPQ